LSKTEAGTLKVELEDIRLAQAKEREDLLHQLHDAYSSQNEEKKVGANSTRLQNNYLSLLTIHLKSPGNKENLFTTSKSVLTELK
jgi:hypothetical protein